MERHLTTSTVSIGKQNEAESPGDGAGRVGAVIKEGALEPFAHWDPRTGSQHVSVWRHTLVLTGELTHRSAHTLEVELERLCEDGVTAIMLDLRQLAHIDSIGVAVIAFRCGLYHRRGLAFTLVPGSRSIQRAFERAGLGDLPFQVDELGARRLRAAGARKAFSRRR
jgi:anti-anti-sigma factor